MNNSTDKIWVLITDRSDGLYRDRFEQIDKMEAVRMKLAGIDVFDLTDLIEDDNELEYMVSEEV